MSSIKDVKDARRIGLDFARHIDGYKLEELLPGTTEHNRNILGRLIREAVYAGESINDVTDSDACASLHHFFLVVGGLCDEGRLLTTAPAGFVEQFIDCLEIAEAVTDMEALQ